MYDAEDMPEANRASERPGDIIPTVTVLSMTPDPLGSLAAACMMYEGRVVRDLHDITDDERRHYFTQVQNTHLKAPMEYVDFHFIVEGVTRSFTHQMVRQRTAVYSQESLRFAVKNDIDETVALPPSLRSLKEDDPRVVAWQVAVNGIDDAYHALVESGIPAEDARGLLPHNITTRLHYKTDLRGLLEHGGNRLCTQAQFEWRLEFTALVNAIRNYRGPGYSEENQWQYDAISNIFRPICYLTGKCEFNASFDRACSIRDRVDAFHQAGFPSERWDKTWDQPVPPHGDGKVLLAIHPRDWLMDPAAARVAQ
jgi:flavin-dependent thymidylate synthase